MQKRSAAALINRHGLRRCITKVLALMLCFVLSVSMIAAPSVAHASDFTDLVVASAKDWLAGWTGQNTGVWNPVDPLVGFWSVDSSKNIPATVNKSQNYYTTPTSSVQDKYGNVTNYYRGGDTTNTNIIDSYNKTFNTIWNTNNTTNNYQANVKLDNFLNQYTTNNVTNKYTYSADFKSWYYDNTTNNYNYNQFTKNDYTQNNLYYNQDNSRYYISIDNSTDEYYLIDVQYSPTFVTVNYTYNTTNNNYDNSVGDVTNVYYYELKDGRNSSTLTAAEVAGLDTGYDVANYELVTDDPNTLSLQHFDGDYTDSSSYNRTFYSQNRSTNFVDSGAFGKAVSLPNGSTAGVTIPGLSSYDTCILAGSVEYTCSKCEKTKTETLTKLGHTWEVKQSVQTSYDENGEIITQGFTIYRCSVCGEEYKTENGTGPPGSGAGGSGSEISDSVLDKFPSFVNMVLSMFQQLPKLFEGFVAFLTEVFAYVPEDIILLLTFGVAVVVLIGIIKAVRA